MAWLKSDFPLARDDAQRVLPLIITCLVAFVGLLLSLALSLFISLGQQTHNAEASLQIEIPYMEKNAEKTLRDVVAYLKSSDGIVDVEVISPQAMEALLAPWLGSGISLEDMQLPTMLDVTTQMRGDTPAVNRAALQSKLQRLAVGATVEDRGPWMKHLARGSAVLQWLLMAVACMVLTCIAALIALVARTSLKLHFQTVSLLHMFGATDDYIVRQFQQHHGWLVLKNAAIGTAIAASVYVVAGLATNASSSPIMPHIALSATHVGLLVLLPLLTAYVARMAARHTVQGMLHTMH
jgi:cell division transport system permease protein